MSYAKVRGHHSWWLSKNGKSIGHFNIDGLTSEEEAEAYVDEIVKLEAEGDAYKEKLKKIHKIVDSVEFVSWVNNKVYNELWDLSEILDN